MDGPATDSGSRILLLFEQPKGLSALSRTLTHEGFDVAVAEGGLKMLETLRQRNPRVSIVLLVGDVICISESPHLLRTCERHELPMVLRRATSRCAAARERIVSRCENFTSVVDLIEQVAATRASVLLQGESGTGKELLARLLHASSLRSAGPFVPVNCAAMLSGLTENSFCGHAKGAFTGADSDREGFLQAADGGTLLLDEIADFPREAQGTLLRVLQEGRVTRLGCTRSEAVDIRLVSATTQDLEVAVKDSRFRRDLLYRINVVLIQVPPLRERVEDIPLLVAAFLSEFRTSFGRGPSRVTTAVELRLMEHRWPGNVRELRNVIERAFAVCDDDCIDMRHLPPYLQGATSSVAVTGLTSLDLAERRQIELALALAGGQKTKAAHRLGIDRKRLYRKLKRLGMSS